MSNYHFGGAFDVEDDAFFTREDLDEFAQTIADMLNTDYGDDGVAVSVIECYAKNTVNIVLTLDISTYDDEYEQTVEQHIDLRRIRNTLEDLLKNYKFKFLDEFRDSIESSLIY